MIDVFEKLSVDRLLDPAHHPIRINEQDGDPGLLCRAESCRIEIQSMRNRRGEKYQKFPFECSIARAHSHAVFEPVVDRSVPGGAVSGQLFILHRMDEIKG